MDHINTSNLTAAMQSIGALNNKEREMLLAVLGTTPKNQSIQTTTNNKAANVQRYVNSIVKHHNAIGLKQNLKRLEKFKKTQEIGGYFLEATVP